MKYYTLKFWLTTIVLAITIFIIGTIIVSKEIDSDFAGLAFFMFLYSICYSFPAFLIITLIQKKVLKNLDMKNRFLLSSVSIILMLVTIFTLFGKDKFDVNKNYSGLSFSIIFMISIVLSTFIIKPTEK
jgi:membrane protease YdiL (CAAX protease family)